MKKGLGYILMIFFTMLFVTACNGRSESEVIEPEEIVEEQKSTVEENEMPVEEEEVQAEVADETQEDEIRGFSGGELGDSNENGQSEIVQSEEGNTQEMDVTTDKDGDKVATDSENIPAVKENSGSEIEQDESGDELFYNKDINDYMLEPPAVDSSGEL